MEQPISSLETSKDKQVYTTQQKRGGKLIFYPCVFHEIWHIEAPSTEKQGRHLNTLTWSRLGWNFCQILYEQCFLDGKTFLGVRVSVPKPYLWCVYFVYDFWSFFTIKVRLNLAWSILNFIYAFACCLPIQWIWFTAYDIGVVYGR